MNGRKSIKSNYIFNVTYQLFALLVPLIVTPYISRVLGAASIGYYSYTYSIVSYFAIFAALGTGTYGVREVGVSNDKYNQSTSFFNILIFRSLTTLISLVFYITYSLLFCKNDIVVWLQGLNIVAVIFDISWFFQGVEDFKKVSIKNFIIKIISVICVFVFVKSESDLWIYILCLAGFIVLGNISMWFSLPKYICKVSREHIRPSKDIKSIGLLFFPTIAIQIYALVDKTLIGTLINETIVVQEPTIVNGVETTIDSVVKVSNLENGYYEQADKIIKMCSMVVTSLGTVMIPKIASAYRCHKNKEVSTYLKKSFNFVWLMTVPMCLGIIAITKDFVPVFFGVGYEKVKILLPIFSILFVFLGINSVIGNQYLISTGQQGKFSLLLLIGGTVNILLDVILIPHFYSIGAAIGSIVGETIITVLGLLLLFKTKVCSFKDVFGNCWKYFIGGIIMFVTTFGVSLLLNEFGLAGVLLEVCIGIISYIIVILLLRDKFLIEMTKPYLLKVKSRFSKKKQ